MDMETFLWCAGLLVMLILAGILAQHFQLSTLTCVVVGAVIVQAWIMLLKRAP